MTPAYNRPCSFTSGFYTFWLFALLFATIGSVQAQRQNIASRYVRKVLNDTTDIREPQFLMYPVVGYAPETSWEFGFSSVFVYYAGRDTTNRLSEISAFTFLTLEQQYGLWFDHALYSDKNKWFLLGRLRFQSFPLLFYGIGPNTPKEPQALVDASLIQIKERLLRKVRKSLYFGLEVDFQRLSNVNFIPRSDETLVLPNGAEGSANLGLGLGILYDNRHNILNVREGFFSELAFLRYSTALGSDFSFGTVISDTRLYRPVNKRDVFAAQLFGQFNSGDIPFNQLALMGGETIMRGYYLGRFRDNNQIAAQIEYRMLPLPWSFTKRWGATFFASTGTVFSDFNALTTRNVVVAGGGGLRFLLFPKKDIFTRLDVAFTKEGSGIYLYIGEAF